MNALGRRLRAALAVLLCTMLCWQAMPAWAEEGGDPAPDTGVEVAAETMETESSPDAETPADPTEATPVTDDPSPAAEPTESTEPAPSDAGESDAPVTDAPTTDTPTTGTPTTDVPAAAPARPTCDLPDCPHVTLGPDGVWTALCPLGQWMIDNGEVEAPVAAAAFTLDATVMTMLTLMAATDPKTIVLTDGTTTLYRSGTYVLTGGLPTSRVVIADNLAVALVLADATLERITLGTKVSLQLGFTGVSTVSQLRPSDSEIFFDGLGSLTIDNVDDFTTVLMTMGGGNLLLPGAAVSQNGNSCYHFYAAGATSATVDGAAFPFTTADNLDMAHLWLPPPDAGASYRASVESTVLTVRSVAEEPSSIITFDMDSDATFTSSADKSYSIFSSGHAPKAHMLTVDQTGVSLLFNGVDFSAYADVVANQPARLHLQASSAIQSLSGSSSATLTGTGTFTVGTLSVASLQCAHAVRLVFGSAGGTALSAWQALPSPITAESVTGLTYEGRSYAVATTPADSGTVYTPLPAPDAGMRYDVQTSGTDLVVTQMPTATQTIVLTDAGYTFAADGNYVVLTDGACTGSLTVPDGRSMTLTLRGARTAGSLTLGEGASAAVTLDRSNRLDGGIALGNGATLSLNGSGALQTDRVEASGAANISVGAHTNVTLVSGTALGGSSLAPTVISVTDASAMPVCNLAITLKIGTASPFATTTAADGHVTLWGKKTLSGASVVVLSQANTYADILTGGPANPDALPVISGVTIHPEGYVTYTATNAQTTGIQVYLNRPGVDMPDTYVADAMQVLRYYGECNIPGLKEGDQVTFRVYAARSAGQPLNAETADAFQFSDIYTFVAPKVRKVYTLADQTKEYDTEPFKFDSGLIPKDASVTFSKNGHDLSSAPTDIGVYTATVVIPDGNPDFFPAVVTAKVSITRKIVWIYADYASKLKGEEDPEFTYFTSELFDDDEVTGHLYREKGELYGNYPYVTWGLNAPSIYELRLDPESPMFFIDWGPGHYIKVDPMSIIDPIHQTLLYSDGTKLDLILRTVDRLTISKTTYGPLVTNPDDRKTRPFTPELRLKHGYNQAMVILEAEPEINDDGGYATDADGNILLGDRTLTLTAYHLSRFRSQHITTLGFRLEGVMFTVDLADFSAEPVRTAMAEAGMSVSGTRYQVTLHPINRVSDLADRSEAAQNAKALGAQMMDVSVTLQNGSQTLDVAKLLPSARTLFDTGSLLADAVSDQPALREITNGRDASAADDESITADDMELVLKLMKDRLRKLGAKLNFFNAKTEKLDSRLVVPYTASEAETYPYTAVMRTSPYLMVRHARNGLYGLTVSP